jgi:hypothetical protein
MGGMTVAANEQVLGVTEDLTAAATVMLPVASAFEEVVSAGLDSGVVAAQDAAAGADIVAADAAIDSDQAALAAADDGAAGGDDPANASCGGMSFASSTKVLLANGAAVPISELRVGDEVDATSVKTGRTQAEPVTAVLVHHDTDLYDLSIVAGHRTAVIHTTRNHLFFDLTRNRWVAAAALALGDRLRGTHGQETATIMGGRATSTPDGWMWDIDVPGDGDHDFYVDVVNVPVLVHNCDKPGMPNLHGHYPTQLSAALKDTGITDPDLAVTDNYDGGPQMLGPRGEPWQTIEGFDDTGGVRDIELHNAHSFPDGSGFGPHYIDQDTGFHYFWDDP